MLSEVSSANGSTSYQYDANGSLTIKENTGKFSYHYGYDLRNRLASATITRKEGLNNVSIASSYAYNTEGIRTRALQTINGITQNRYFLLDDGHTGYAQVFEETSSLGGSMVRSYVLGDDVLSQNVGGTTSHLLYDGHGSTRQLSSADGIIIADYKYDAYGKMLGGDPNVTDRQSATDLLYVGEQFDAGLQMEYLRARYYDQNTGRFNRLDPFDGNNEDPQSLHKYAYAHCDPVNGIDPSGESLIGLISTIAIIASISVTTLPTVTQIYTSANTILNYRDAIMLIAESDADIIDKFITRNFIIQLAMSEFRTLFSAVGEFGQEVIYQVTTLLLYTAILKAAVNIIFVRHLLTTGDGFFITGIRVKFPFDVPVQRFGTMSIVKTNCWGIRLGSKVFPNRFFAAIKPKWNDLTIYTTGVIPKGTEVVFGLIGPQGVQYMGGSFQFLVWSRLVQNQLTQMVR